MAIEAERPLDTRQMFVENYLERSSIVEWTTPKFEEVCLNCEINSYASAAM
jgi:coenzyme PQQ precursor peptide PqqA